MKFTKETFSNGLRVLTVPQAETKAMTLLFLVGAGSRYETPAESGISHFLEHILFKGTEKYPNPQILAQTLDGIGANFNAYTGQEYTGFYIEAAATHFPLALDVLHEMFYHPRYAHEDIEREKGVIVEEINMYRDLPQRHVYELLFSTIFGDVPMGWNIAGDKKTVNSFTKKNFEDYQTKFYTPDNIIVAVGGNEAEYDWLGSIKKLLGSKKGKLDHNFTGVMINQGRPKIVVEQRQTDQTHLAIGLPSLPETDSRQPVLDILNIILGGSMSSRLFIEVREKRGLAYYVRSANENFHDTGVFSVATGVRNSHAKEALKIILEQLDLIRSKPVENDELKRAKEFYKGKMALTLEGSQEVTSFYTQQELYYGHQITLAELEKKVEAVTKDDIQNLATELFVGDRLNLAAIGPFTEEDFCSILERY
ncbi:insulinase family protein [Candidatus Berkelbacteria bacterium]|nr:insulinase family protein [Candidatus Berkelbacteria bacterium]